MTEGRTEGRSLFLSMPYTPSESSHPPLHSVSLSAHHSVETGGNSKAQDSLATYGMTDYSALQDIPDTPSILIEYVINVEIREQSHENSTVAVTSESVYNSLSQTLQSYDFAVNVTDQVQTQY